MITSRISLGPIPPHAARPMTENRRGTRPPSKPSLLTENATKTRESDFYGQLPVPVTLVPMPKHKKL